MAITRREFLGAAIAAGLPACAAPATQDAPTTEDIHEYLLKNSPWVDRKRTVDTVKCGDRLRPVRKAGVCWYPSIRDIRAAVKAGCDLLITHEPTFWDHSAAEQPWRAKGPGIAKSKLLKESGLVVLRAHDTWDNWPELGIRDSWARFLGLGRLVKGGSNLRWHGLYEAPEQTLREFAAGVAGRVRELGEDSVQVMGDPRRRVRRIAVGVGCAVPDTEMVEAGADVLVVCFDGASYWHHRERNFESGAAVVTVEHGTSEMPGMMSLRGHLARVFPAVEFVWLAEHPRPWTVTA